MANDGEPKRLAAEVKLLESFSLGKNTKKASGMELTIYGKEGNLLGTIKIGAGSFEWWPAHAKKRQNRFDWNQFSDVMDKLKNK